MSDQELCDDLRRAGRVYAKAADRIEALREALVNLVANCTSRNEQVFMSAHDEAVECINLGGDDT